MNAHVNIIFDTDDSELIEMTKDFIQKERLTLLNINFKTIEYEREDDRLNLKCDLKTELTINSLFEKIYACYQENHSFYKFTITPIGETKAQEINENGKI